MIEPLICEIARAEKELGENFEADGKTYLVRCPKCGKENHASFVAQGKCAWCGYNVNGDRDA